MRVLSLTVNWWVDPSIAFTSLYGADEAAMWLDSGIHATTGTSVVGSLGRVVTADVEGSTVTADGDTRRETIFDFLRRELAAAAIESDAAAKIDAADEGAFRLGWVGWLGYEVRAQTMGVEATRRSRYPDAALGFVDHAVTFDHGTRTMTLLAFGDRWEGDAAAWRDTTITMLEGLRGADPGDPRPSADGGQATWAYRDADYLAMIAECQAAIRAGEAYQLCLTSEAEVATHEDPLAVYRRLRAASPTHHGAYLRLGGVALLCASPEQFLEVSPGGRVQTKPIKGTRRRGATPDDDERLARELVQSDKERAENLMIVDLMRNDLAKVAVVGSVEVPTLFAVETYAQVHQLVSTVRGTLLPGASGVDAVEACFPAGSMTGAPKRRATELLDRIEGRARGIYSGAVGYFGLDGRVDLAMVIRSIVFDGAGATVGSGGGITALSVPAEELEEVKLKAAALLRVLGAS